MSGVGWAHAAATLFVGFVALWLVHSYRRQARLKLIERQLDAYQKLWTLTAPATPRHFRGVPSLLRAQLKADLSLHFGLNYYSRLLPEDQAFLTSCGISTWRRPWRSSPLRKQRHAGVNNCVCGLCPTA